MAGVSFSLNAVPSGDTPYAIIQQAGGGQIWNPVSGSFEASPSASDRRIAMTQDGQIPSSWHGVSAKLGTFTGVVVVHLFSADDNAYGGLDFNIADGNESNGQALETTSQTILSAVNGLGGVAGISPTTVAESRTWVLLGETETGVARQAVTLQETDVVTLSMDFSERLGDVSLAAVASVGDSEAILTFANLKVDRSSRQAHFDITGGLDSGEEHELTIVVTTDDGQTLSGKGALIVA